MLVTLVGRYFSLAVLAPVNQPLVAGVIGRVNVDALYLTGIAGQQGLERMEVVATIALTPGPSPAGGRGERKFRRRFQQAERYILVVFDDGFLADPVQGGH